MLLSFFKIAIAQLLFIMVFYANTTDHGDSLSKEILSKNRNKQFQLIDLDSCSFDQDQKEDLGCLVEAVKLDYLTSSEIFKDWISRGCASDENINYFFTLIKESLDVNRYNNNTYQKAEIIRLVHSIDSSIAKDLNVLIDKVVFLLQSLKIHYHNIQHTLEVTLGTTQALLQCYRDGLIKDLRSILIPIVAALFHDIGYANAEELISCIQRLPSDEYTLLFHEAKDSIFLEDFRLQVQKTFNFQLLTGAEFHLHHVYLSQVLLPQILSVLPDSFVNKQFLLSKDSLEKINAIISLTDLKPDPKKYRDDRRNYSPYAKS